MNCLSSGFVQVEEYLGTGTWLRMDGGSWMEELREHLTVRKSQGLLYLRQRHAGAMEIIKCILESLKGKLGNYIDRYLLCSLLSGIMWTLSLITFVSITVAYHPNKNSDVPILVCLIHCTVLYFVSDVHNFDGHKMAVMVVVVVDDSCSTPSCPLCSWLRLVDLSLHHKASTLLEYIFKKIISFLLSYFNCLTSLKYIVIVWMMKQMKDELNIIWLDG